jgi:hypothetical protein
MNRRSAIDCLRRGFLSTRANLGLLPLKALQDLLVTLLIVASLLPPFLVLGGQVLLEGGWSEAALEGWLAGLGDEVASRMAPVALAIVASLVIGLLAVLVWGWFEGGLLGILVAAERQARPGAEDHAGGWRWFRTFSLRDFSGWGGRHLWRFFWFFHLTMTAALVLVVIGLLLALAAVYGGESWGAGAAFGIGCGGALPLAFAFLVYALWFSAAQPAVALEGSGAVRGSALGLRVVGRRLGAALLLLLVMMVVATVVGIALAVGQGMTGLLIEDSLGAWVALYLSFFLVQVALGAALNVFILASYSALVVAEVGGEPQ